MLSVKENQRLTQVGPGTPMGELLRRYWYPIAASLQMDEEPTRAVKLLGEDLVLYRDRSGTLGLIQEACAHRRVNMLYGIPEQTGIRCPYHGWLYDETGRCLEMPAEAPDSTFKDRVTVTAYPVQELGGLVWAYLGPQPAPLIPRWDLLVWDDVARDIGFGVIPCNWLQIMENSLDPVHVEWLHGRFPEYVLERQAKADFTGMYWTNVGPSVAAGKHLKLGFDVYEHGIVKRRVVEGTDESHPAWRIGHPILFPNILRVSTFFEFRVPMDDLRTLDVVYQVHAPPEGVPVPEQPSIPYYHFPVAGFDERGQPEWDAIDYTLGQDIVAWRSQGPLADRSQERLGESDRGVILFRRLLQEQMKTLEDGGQPMNVFRDAAANEIIEIPWEGSERGGRHHGVVPLSAGGSAKYSPVLRMFTDQATAESATRSPA